MSLKGGCQQASAYGQGHLVPILTLEATQDVHVERRVQSKCFIQYGPHNGLMIRFTNVLIMSNLQTRVHGNGILHS